MVVKNCLQVYLLVICIAAFKYSAASPQAGGVIYQTMQSDDTAKINAGLSALEKSAAKEKDAYTGALLMKKSGMEKSPLEKLSVFKKGRLLLEQSIRQDSLNAEYRFLRLLIQEHVPDFLNYHSRKDEDARLIRQSYKKLSPELRQAILDYSNNSHVLKPEDFKK
jgi:hypothetical protein